MALGGKELSSLLRKIDENLESAGNHLPDRQRGDHPTRPTHQADRRHRRMGRGQPYRAQ